VSGSGAAGCCRVDPVIMLLGAAPVGITGMSLVGAEFGVGAAVATLFMFVAADPVLIVLCRCSALARFRPQRFIPSG